MKLTSELYYLTLISLMTAVMWMPYTVARILTRGLRLSLANPDPSHPPDPAWAQRAQRAHANAIENLAVFAPLVLIAAAMGISTPSTVFAAKLYLFARLVHYCVYAAGIPVARTLAFVTGSGATLVFAFVILGFIA
ncbi:MAPEG family protein [Herbaspirillum rhizosphaerae]|uniref:MAPEG family protein n=1 Tax=Herbaspirillum rhizosphaerae TaxID=346179 RepID=A0ABW8ZC94_9BURK